MNPLILTLLSLLFLTPQQTQSTNPDVTPVCIVGSGIGGASVAHFLRLYAPAPLGRIRVFELQAVVGGRMATVAIGGDTFEAGASILHPRNFHARNFSHLLNLGTRDPSSSKSSSFSLGIWDGNRFVFKTLSPETKNPVFEKLASLVNSVMVIWRYGFSLLRMNSFVEIAVDKFLKFYESFESRPVFETVDEMLNWAGLYSLTRRTLHEELIDASLSPLLINELVNVITRINYGQSSSISGLAGAVSLAGSGGGLWAIKGGNWQIAAGLINQSDVSLHLNEKVESIVNLGSYYELNSTKGTSYKCEVTVVATPLDESDIHFDPPISISERKLQHTHATFVRGLLNPAYFGMGAVSEIPELVGSIEDPDLPFTSISVLKRYNEKEMTYKIFSRKPMSDALLDNVFSVRNETIHINWAAYPRYNAPEVFSPFILDGQHLYYVNAFENAASTMETSAVSAENMARLILSRWFGQGRSLDPKISTNEQKLHVDL